MPMPYFAVVSVDLRIGTTLYRQIYTELREELMKSFGDRLRFARETKRLSRRAVGEKIGRTARTVERWEAGETKPTAGDAIGVADAIGVDYEWLRSGKGELPEDDLGLVLPEDARAILGKLTEAVAHDAPTEKLLLLLYAFADRLDATDPSEVRELEEIKRRLLERAQGGDDAL